MGGQGPRSQSATCPIQPDQGESGSPKNAVRSSYRQPPGNRRVSSRGQRRSGFDYVKRHASGFGLARIAQEPAHWFWHRRTGRLGHSYSARSHRRSDGVLQRISASLFRKHSRSDSERKDKGQSGSTPAGRCASCVRGVVSEYSFVDFLHALRGASAKKLFDYKRSPERRQVDGIGQSGHYHGTLRCAHVADRFRPTPGCIARSVRNFIEDWFLRSPERGSKLARSGGTNGCSDAFRFTARQDLVSAERTSTA